MVITRLSKWFGIELHCVSTDRVSDLAAIEWLHSQRLITGYLVVMGGDQPHNKRSRNTGACKRVISFISSAVPSGSGAFQMPTRPSSASSSSSAAASTLRGGEGPISETLQ